MIKKTASILALFSVLALLSTIGGAAFSQSDPNLSKNLLDNLQKQKELEAKLAEAQKKAKTLANEIVYMDGQITLTELKIEEAKTKIAQAETDLVVIGQDITETESKIQILAETVKKLTSVAKERLKASYLSSKLQDPVFVFMGSRDLDNLILKFAYLKEVRDADSKLLLELDTTKKKQDETKTYLEGRKVDTQNVKTSKEQEKANLESREKALERQKAGKADLLKITKNDEANYQGLLAQIKAEIAAIERALGTVGKNLRPVARGEMVAKQGNTGCSTGTHLHFALYLNGSSTATNPKSYLDSGTLGKPEAGYPDNVTQWYGENYDWYMSVFGIPGHNGIDMSDSYGAPIFAAEDGEAYLSDTDPGCPGVPGITGTVPGKGIVLCSPNCTDPTRKTIYWHVQ